LLGLLVFMVVADGLITNVLVNYDIAREWNPLMVSLAGKSSMVVIKIIGAVVCTLILWDIHKHAPKLAIVSAYILTTAYTVIVLWNITLFLRAAI
jgi:hypothetical protein